MWTPHCGRTFSTLALPRARKTSLFSETIRLEDPPDETNRMKVTEKMFRIWQDQLDDSNNNNKSFERLLI